ncbi:2-phospho-L-lactate guanylyltransferase [Halorubrum aquaticum]|uniref:2-phospho-L-lactate guanylyltransferase n=1 Tax=Halorubrum aquaticum TaxID=387340 RepID=A0A1I3BB41_9EURY|nr:2-phospho-L-lactate guanylyltransferase [Halorubrum aquaticum]SFH59523.1 2-phospho-L-lactate guanylyltransferase [Halorubrum aquaticum]
MEVLVPFSADRPKSRLADALSPSERAAFARTMLADVLAAIGDAGGSPRILATDGFDPTDEPTVPLDPPVTVDDRPLTDAVNAVLEERRPGGEGDPLAVVMADLALATPAALRELFAAGREADVAIAPGRGGGTNALVVSHPRFHVDYHGASYLDHRRIAADVGAGFAAVDSHRLGTDIDETDDLAEVLIHGEGQAATWLREAGFALDASEGRVAVVRE